ncbi:YeeE/YedE family protein [Propionivibrio limicola]|uniref:YeeE/YedE family protein n=1 Tax=Propionivibrio limicola TaxID=167645 RepID=UPI001291BF52|nr:YeeE/YedE family protein [Propionivibrio limicola]
MTIDWNQFTPLSALLGGLLIGLAVTLMLLFKGRIAGISGIVGGLLQRPQNGDLAWRATFILGLLLAPVLYGLFAPLPGSRIEADTVSLVLAGLLVGFGTRLGSGCTSGHGVCGISRLSPRSLVATATFMLTGFTTVFAIRHLFA